MAIITIGRPAYFFVLFVDEDQNPIALTTPTIHLFTFDAGVEVVLEDGVMIPTSEVGKYLYSYLIPPLWSYDSNLYAHMRGTDSNGTQFLTEQQFDLWNADGTPFTPPPPMSHWNTDDGANGDEGFVSPSVLSFQLARVPTSSGGEGSPLYAGDWASTTQGRVTKTKTLVLSAGGYTTGFGGDSTFLVDIKVPSGASLELSVFTAVGDGVQTSVSNGVSFSITNYRADEQRRFKANAVVTIDLETLLQFYNLVGARISVTTTHITDVATDGGLSSSYTESDFYYDLDIKTPEVANVQFQEQLKVIRQLSGIAYYAVTSRFGVTVTGIDHLNNASSKHENNLTITAINIGLPTLEQSPFGVGSANFTGWNSNENSIGVSYQKLDWEVSNSNYRALGSNISVEAHANDAWANGLTVSSPTLPVLIDTFIPTSTSQYAGFDDENHRMQSDYVTGWDSAHHLTSGEALVQGGQLQIPHTDWTPYLPLDPSPNPNYTTLNQAASYYRVFDVLDNGLVSHSNFTLTIQGVFASSLEQDLINGDIQIFVRRKASVSGAFGTGSAPLSVHGTAYNHTLFDDGATNGQIREFVVGNSISLTFGGYAVREGVYVEFRLTNPLVKLDSVLVSFMSG